MADQSPSDHLREILSRPQGPDSPRYKVTNALTAELWEVVSESKAKDAAKDVEILAKDVEIAQLKARLRQIASLAKGDP